MTNSNARPTSFAPTTASPGTVIKDLMESRDVDPINLAYDLGLSHTQFADLLIGDVILTSEMANILGKTFRMPASTWMECEIKYRKSK